MVTACSSIRILGGEHSYKSIKLMVGGLEKLIKSKTKNFNNQLQAFSDKFIFDSILFVKLNYHFYTMIQIKVRSLVTNW